MRAWVIFFDRSSFTNCLLVCWAVNLLTAYSISVFLGYISDGHFARHFGYGGGNSPFFNPEVVGHFILNVSELLNSVLGECFVRAFFLGFCFFLSSSVEFSPRCALCDAYFVRLIYSLRASLAASAAIFWRSRSTAAPLRRTVGRVFSLAYLFASDARH